MGTGRLKIGLALGSGSARGCSHIGVIRVLPFLDELLGRPLLPADTGANPR